LTRFRVFFNGTPIPDPSNLGIEMLSNIERTVISGFSSGNPLGRTTGLEIVQRAGGLERGCMHQREN